MQKTRPACFTGKSQSVFTATQITPADNSSAGDSSILCRSSGSQLGYLQKLPSNTRSSAIIAALNIIVI